MLHVLLHMAEQKLPQTSEVLAQAMATNPAVLRRLMAGLREAGLVSSGKGHGGGWVLARDLAEISLHDVYVALGRPAILSIGNRADNPSCLVEQAVNSALAEAFDAAEARLLHRFGEISLAQLNADFHARLNTIGARPGCGHDVQSLREEDTHDA